MQAMIQSPMLPVLMGGIGALFVVLFIIGQVMARSTNARGMNARLEQFGGKSSSADKNMSAEALAKIDAVVSKSKRGGAMARDLARADLKMKVSEFVALKIAVALLGAAIGAYLGRASTAAMVGTGLIGAVLFSFTPNIYVNFRAANRIKSFNNQLGDTITMMANALRGGYSFLQTLDMVSKEAPAPVSDEFRRIVQEVGLGRTTEEALDSLLRRVPSDDLDLLITAVKIQMEVGGNLAQILDTIGHTIRERVRIKGEIKTLTAQGRISAYVITALPVGLAIFISVINPEFMAPIFTFGFPPEAWCCLPATSVVMIVIGYFTIMKIIDIEV